jgi:D-3-phosphoglycerate dehydrogenase / 2-oxoglutarate reductase
VAQTRPRALVTSPLRGPGLDKLRTLLDVVYDPWLDQQPLRIYNAAQLAERIKEVDATVLIVETDSVKDEVLTLPLVVIGSTRGDPNNVDLAACTAAGIPVINAPGRNADAVAEMAVALLFAVNRHIIRADAEVRADDLYAGGTIPYQRFRSWELNGQTVGLVGLGAVGRALRWRLQGLGLEVIAYDPYNDEATHSLDDLLAEADIVSMHAPVTPDTMKMIGAEQFAAMKDGAVFINTARAALHDTDPLVAALQSGKLGGAGLDHFDGESLPQGHPLTAMTNVVLTPHIGGATYDTETRQSAMIADDIERVLNGDRPRFLVNKEVM